MNPEPSVEGRASGPREEGSTAFVVVITFIAALGGLLFGYDTAVISGAIEYLEKHFALDSWEKGWAGSCALLGCVIGVTAAGILGDRLGRKKTLVLAGVLFLGSSIGTAIPEALWVFVVFRILAGVGVGIASMASPMYIAEIAPARIRGRMVSVNQFAIISGMVVISFVNYYIVRQGDAAWNETVGWRWMFASGVVPSAVFLALLFFVPESPRWLLEVGEKGKAVEVLARVLGPARVRDEIVAIESTLDTGSASFRRLLEPAVLPIVITGTALAVLQQVTGINVFLYYAPGIFKSLGERMDMDTALLQTVVVNAVNLLFTVIAIWTVDRLGRKPLMIVGSIGMGLALAAMGLAAHFGWVGNSVLVFILAYIAFFALSVGPVTWVILSEMFPTALRARALSVATFCLWSANWVVSQTFPMMDKNEGLVARFHHGFPFYIYAVFCVVLLVVVVRRVPETKGKSLEEIEAHWRTRG